jgi:hypothetical protein
MALMRDAYAREVASMREEHIKLKHVFQMLFSDYSDVKSLLINLIQYLKATNTYGVWAQILMELNGMKVGAELENGTLVEQRWLDLVMVKIFGEPLSEDGLDELRFKELLLPELSKDQQAFINGWLSDVPDTLDGAGGGRAFHGEDSESEDQPADEEVQSADKEDPESESSLHGENQPADE